MCLSFISHLLRFWSRCQRASSQAAWAKFGVEDLDEETSECRTTMDGLIDWLIYGLLF